MATLVEVFRLDDHPPLNRRQSPLMIEDQLMMVMDLNKLDLIRDKAVKGRDLGEFSKKYESLTVKELRSAFTISYKEVVSVLSESVPCVGCRRSVERLYNQLMDIGELALDPLQVKSDGMLVIKDEVMESPKSVCSMLYEHSERLSALVDSQPRSKKSRRCVLHSWDLQKSRPVTPAWKDVWNVMHDKCKAEVLLIDFTMLLAKLDSYLKKHRFCADCRTKVMKAYNLLVEDCDPTKEKGFVPALYQKIKRCLPGKHIHLPTETKYIDGLIARAEPELMGNRRERHAKTMEIAQEEVLTCVGICIYDRLHRIFLRLREEEFTCRILAAVALEALCRNFETCVEKKRGITQLELLCKELTKEEQIKQQRINTKKLRKKRKKEKRLELENDGKDSCECEESDEQVEQPEADEDHVCECGKVKPPADSDRHKLQILDRKSKGQLKCHCEDCSRKYSGGSGEVGSVKEPSQVKSCCSEHEYDECQCSSQHTRAANDYGYSSENNSTINSATSSVNSSPEGSEVACSEGFCDHEGECNVDRVDLLKNSKCFKSNGQYQLSLEEMLDNEQVVEDVDEGECLISAEEIQAFKDKMPLVDLKRIELRHILKQRFELMCSKAQSANC